MIFLSPVWLLALLPWTAAAIGLFWDRPPSRGVPFLPLWLGPVLAAPASRGRHTPPVPLILLVISGLFAILAAARFAVFLPGASGAPVTVIVDAGRTMPGEKTVNEAFRKLRPALLEAFGRGALDVITLPAGTTTRGDRSDLSAALKIIPSAVDTRSMLDRNVVDALRDGDTPVVVLSNQKPATASDRVVFVPISAKVSNVGFVSVAVRDSPRVQVMVEIRNDSDMADARLTVTGGSAPVERAIQLPPNGGHRNYFIDLPNTGDTIALKLFDVTDDLPADNTAWLARQRAWPSIDCRAGVAAEVKRMTETYARLRPPREGSVHLAVVDGLFNLPKNSPAIGVFRAPAGGSSSTQPSRGRVRVVEHPVTAYVDWGAATRNVNVPASPGEGWEPIVSNGEQVYVAIREQPARQVWCAMPSADWPRSADFVVFWTDVFDWAGEGSNYFETGSPNDVHAGWTKVDGPRDLEVGLYKRPDGTTFASSSLDIQPAVAFNADGWHAALFKSARNFTITPLELSRPANLAAAALVLAASLCGAPGALRRCNSRRVA